MRLVLVGDMLTKVDMMSMANSLEVRVPFLDYTVVEYVFGLPAQYKTTPKHRKRILQDAARSILPAELYNRPKQGFEVPLAGWFTGSLRSYLEKEVLAPDYLRAQGLFDPQAVNNLWQAVLRGENGKEDWALWALVVFQHCYKKWGFSV
jgi:asparagine synthase (glutamine-hydrolysing)